ISPAAGGTPQALAMPRHNGSATKNTTTDARKSFLKAPGLVSSGRSDAPARLSVEEEFSIVAIPRLGGFHGPQRTPAQASCETHGKAGGGSSPSGRTRFAAGSQADTSPVSMR